MSNNHHCPTKHCHQCWAIKLKAQAIIFLLAVVVGFVVTGALSNAKPQSHADVTTVTTVH